MSTAIANSNNVYTYMTDYAAAASIYTAASTSQNTFSWTQELLVPGVQIAANILMLEWQKNEAEKLENRRIGYIDQAISHFKECIQGVLNDMEAATDDVPEPAMYQPVSPAAEQWETVSEHIQMMPTMSCLANKIGCSHREHDLARMIVLNPKYYWQSNIVWISIEKLIQGELPIGSTMAEFTRTAEGSVMGGRLGRAHGSFRRNIGILDYNLQRAGRAERREEIAMLNQHVNPLPRQGDVRDMIVTPAQKIGFALQQAQYLQASLQNAYDACSKKAPYLMKRLELITQRCNQVMNLDASKAQVVSTYMPDYTGIFGSQVKDLASGIGNAAKPSSWSSSQTNQQGPPRAQAPNPTEHSVAGRAVY